MGDLLKLYERGFAKLQPAVHFDDQLTSTVAAVGDVSSGRAEIGLLGREIWPAETQAFEASRGHAPKVIEVATGSYDVPKATFALMIFVSRSNPIGSLSTSQLERIFAASDEPIHTWGELGLKGEWATRPIHLYGFTVDNDKSQIFSKLVFHNGERWSPGLKEFSNVPGPGGADAGELIVQAIANDPNGIGISNVHYATLGVKALALSTREGGAPIAPTRENVCEQKVPADSRGLHGDGQRPRAPGQPCGCRVSALRSQPAGTAGGDAGRQLPAAASRGCREAGSTVDRRNEVAQKARRLPVSAIGSQEGKTRAVFQEESFARR
jgi:phosphate transport system substrate-binding protein